MSLSNRELKRINTLELNLKRLAKEVICGAISFEENEDGSISIIRHKQEIIRVGENTNSDNIFVSFSEFPENPKLNTTVHLIFNDDENLPQGSTILEGGTSKGYWRWDGEKWVQLISTEKQPMTMISGFPYVFVNTTP